jgi:hypothetical protein
MKAQDLILCGFKKKTDGFDCFWYELKVKGGHTFITNELKSKYTITRK